jgi:cytochrome c biogenesis protein CcmG, thiol:disulfide interchange protein DsbE
LRERPLRLVGLAALAVVAVAAIVVVAFVPLTGPDPVVVRSSPLLDRSAPEIDLSGLDGERVRLSDHLGRPVVVNFWASWCVPCRDEFPLLVAAREAHAAEGLEILGVVHDDFEESARAFAAEQGAAWPMPVDSERVAWEAYGAVGVPTTYFVDPEGVIRAVSFGPFTEAGLAQQLGTILPARDADSPEPGGG